METQLKEEKNLLLPLSNEGVNLKLNIKKKNTNEEIKKELIAPSNLKMKSKIFNWTFSHEREKNEETRAWLYSVQEQIFQNVNTLSEFGLSHVGMLLMEIDDVCQSVFFMCKHERNAHDRLEFCKHMKNVDSWYLKTMKTYMTETIRPEIRQDCIFTKDRAYDYCVVNAAALCRKNDHLILGDLLIYIAARIREVTYIGQDNKSISAEVELGLICQLMRLVELFTIHDNYQHWLLNEIPGEKSWYTFRTQNKNKIKGIQGGCAAVSSSDESICNIQ